MEKMNTTQREKHLSDEEFIVSKTDTKGKILYGNKTFIKYSGYEEKELLDQPHSILRHPHMPKIVFELLWNRLKDGKEIFAYVKNRCKDGSFYWVFANVTVTKDENGHVVDYHSVRRKPSTKAMDTIPSLYQKLLSEENKSGVNASKVLLEKTLTDGGMTYDDFIFNLQH